MPDESFVVGCCFPFDSPNTLHRAMQELHRLGVIVRKRRSGTEVVSSRGKRTGFIAIVFPHQNDLLEINYLRGIRSALPDDVHLISCDTLGDPNREAYYLKKMLQEASSIICFPTGAPQNTHLYQRLLEEGVPVVCVDRVPDGVAIDGVVTGNYASSLRGLRAVDQMGHRYMAHFTQHDLWVSAVRERYQAFVDVCGELGHEDTHRWIRQFPIAFGVNREYLIQLATDALYTLTHLLVIDGYFRLFGISQPPKSDANVRNDGHAKAMRRTQIMGPFSSDLEVMKDTNDMWAAYLAPLWATP